MSTNVRPLGIIVTSIGRRAGLERLIDSLAGADVLLSIAVQGGEYSLIGDLARRCAGLGLEAEIRSSGGGASAGRNDAVSWIAGRAAVLAFPNDTTVFPPGVVQRIIEAVSTDTFSAGAVVVTDPDGPKFRLPDAGTPLDLRNVWDVILPGLLMKTEVFLRLGGFDEELGTGAPTPWQSGEETALLLQFRAEFGPSFTWLAGIHVENPHDTAGLDARHRRRKLRGYARGYGHVIRTYGYGTRGLVRALAAGATFGVRHGTPYSYSDGVVVAIGRAEGFFRVLVGGRGRTALREAPRDLREVRPARSSVATEASSGGIDLTRDGAVPSTSLDVAEL